MSAPQIPIKVTRTILADIPKDEADLIVFTNKWLTAMEVKSPALAYFLTRLRVKTSASSVHAYWVPVLSILIWRSFITVLKDAVPRITDEIMSSILVDANTAIDKGGNNINAFIDRITDEIDAQNPAIAELMRVVLRKVPLGYQRSVCIAGALTYKVVVNKIESDELERKLYGEP